MQAAITQRITHFSGLKAGQRVCFRLESMQRRELGSGSIILLRNPHNACMGQIVESRRRKWIQDINGGCDLKERKDTSFSEIEEGRRGWMIIPRTFGVKRNEAEFADILHPAEITCQPRARETAMKKPFANQNLMKFKGLKSSFCASTISSLTEAGHHCLSF